jgi:hypothetical protein
VHHNGTIRRTGTRKGIRADEAHVYGIISLVVWSITLIVSIKYVTVIMRADNEGEGRIMALIALVQSASLKGRATSAVLVAQGIFGAALFYGDAMITRAISVLSGGRRAQGGGARARVAGGADRAGRAERAVRDPTVRDRGRGTAVRAGNGAVVYRQKRDAVAEGELDPIHRRERPQDSRALDHLGEADDGEALRPTAGQPRRRGEDPT